MWNRKALFAACLAVGIIQSCGEAEFFGFAPTAGSRQENAVDVPHPESPSRRSPERKSPDQKLPAESHWLFLALVDVSDKGNPPGQEPGQNPVQEPHQVPVQEPVQLGYGLMTECAVWIHLQDWMASVSDAGQEAQLIVAPYSDVVEDQRIVGPVPWEYRAEHLVADELCRPVDAEADVERALQFARGLAEQECEPVQVVLVDHEGWKEGEVLEACE